jgi:hypothetical protein
MPDLFVGKKKKKKKKKIASTKETRRAYVISPS